MMKKQYVKPMIIVESFQLDAAVAASCSGSNYIPINHSEETCGYGVSPDMDFQFHYFTNTDICETEASLEGGDANDTLCYMGPLDGLFFVYS